MRKKKETIGKFELIDYGIRGARDAPGSYAVGEWRYRSENSVVGIGDDLAEAVGDCLSQIACMGPLNVERMRTWDTEGMESRIMDQEGWEKIPTQPSVLEEFPEDDGWDSGECERYYYAAIRWGRAGT